MYFFETLCTSPTESTNSVAMQSPTWLEFKSQTATHVYTSCHIYTGLEIIIVVVVYMQTLPREFP